MVRDKVSCETAKVEPGGEVAVYQEANGEARVDVRVDGQSRLAMHRIFFVGAASSTAQRTAVALGHGLRRFGD